MNPRIQELAEQAETKEIGYYFFDKEKFAELIVRECTDIMYNSMQDTKQSYDLAYHAMLAQLIADINDQFGIESKGEKFETAFRKKFEGGLDLSGQETP